MSRDRNVPFLAFLLRLRIGEDVKKLVLENTQARLGKYIFQDVVPCHVIAATMLDKFIQAINGSLKPSGKWTLVHRGMTDYLHRPDYIPLAFSVVSWCSYYPYGSTKGVTNEPCTYVGIMVLHSQTLQNSSHATANW